MQRQSSISCGSRRANGGGQIGDGDCPRSSDDIDWHSGEVGVAGTWGPTGLEFSRLVPCGGAQPGDPPHDPLDEGGTGAPMRLLDVSPLVVGEGSVMPERWQRRLGYRQKRGAQPAPRGGGAATCGAESAARAPTVSQSREVSSSARRLP